MSQVVSEMTDAADRRPADRSGELIVTAPIPMAGEADRRPENYGEFDYKPVPPLAPITVFLGVCAAASLLVLPAVAVGAAGIATGLLCLRQIRRSDGELGGKTVARIGLVLSALFLVSGSALHAYVYMTEVPEGHERVSFNWLSLQEPKITSKGPEVTSDVAALDGKPIFIKGYMFPTRQTIGLKEFVLLKDTGQCCFGGNPKITDMIVVKLKPGMTVNHKEQILVSVAGTFHAQTVAHSGELTAIYSIDGTHFQ